MDTLNLPMQRGETGYGAESIDTNNLRFTPQLGIQRTFDDNNPNTGLKLSQMDVKCMLFRCKVSAGLLPGQAFLFSASVIGETGTTVTQTGTPNVYFGIVDEFLPAAGVRLNDIFWGVVRGPCTPLITSSSGASDGQLYMPSGSDNGKLDIIDPTPDDDAEAMNQAIYALAVAIGTIASGATSARMCLRGNRFGQ